MSNVSKQPSATTKENLVSQRFNNESATLGLMTECWGVATVGKGTITPTAPSAIVDILVEVWGGGGAHICMYQFMH